jgi:hypothetical protein
VVDVDFRSRSRTELFGLGGVGAMLLAHLVWDPAMTTVGIAEFGVAEEDNELVRALWVIHPVAWIVAKVLVVGGAAVLVLRLGIHREPATAWVPYVIAVLGLLGPLGWIELLLAR